MLNYSNFYGEWRDLMDHKSDPRTRNLFLMSSPFPTIVLCLLYVYIVKIAGPNYMANRKPYELKTALIVYNIVQVMWSLFMFVGGLFSGWLDFNWRCQPLDTSDDPVAERLAHGMYLFFLNKFVEFFDTFFFVLRKRGNQITTLHVFHHAIVPVTAWTVVKFTPGGHISLFGQLNSFVHIWMYLYYLLAGLGPHMQKYLWWKKYLTIIQMIQFIVVFFHALQLVFHNPCNFPMYGIYWIIFLAFVFLVLFADFYRNAYNLSKKEKASKVE